MLGPTGEIGESLSSLFNMLQVNQSFIPIFLVFYNLPQTIVYELSNYCIDHPRLGDLLLFRVPFEEHPWGVNAMSCSKENWNACFND
jgi:hypothetical protein